MRSSRSLVFLLALTAPVWIAGCGASGCGEAPATGAGSVVIDWTSGGRYGAGGFAEGEPIGSDTEASASVIFTPAPLSGLLSPELDELALSVTFTTGGRTMRRDDGTTFTGSVPLRLRAVSASSSRWEITTACDEAISCPMPTLAEDGTGHYADGTRFWQRCHLTLRRGEDLVESIFVELHGDGRLESTATAGAVTVTR